MNKLSQDELMILDRVTAKPELQPHFFSKIKQFKWFDALKNNGLLDPSKNPKPVNTEDSYWNIPSWPVTEYLVRSAELLSLDENIEYANAYIALIRDVTHYAKANDYGNHRTWWQFAKICRSLPTQIITAEDIELFDYWLDDRFDHYMVARDLGQWVEELLERPAPHTNQLVMLLMDKLFVVAEIESKFDANKKTPVLRIDNYWASELVGTIAAKAAIVLGQQTVELFEAKLIQALEINGNDKWSVIWRRAIEEHDQNSGSEDVDDILLQAYRDALLAWYQVEKDGAAEAYLVNAINSEYQVIQRTAIYVASEIFELKTVSNIIIPEFFNDKYRHEMWLLLNNNFAQFSDAMKKETLAIIAAMSYCDDDGKIEERPTAYKKSVWYSAIEEHDDAANAEYNKCIAITEQEPEHPAFASYTTVSAGTTESPVSLVDLKIMLKEPEKMVIYLNEYDHVGHFGDAGLEGLVKSFGQLVEDESQHILKYSQNLLLLKPYYQYEIFNAFEKLWNDKKSLNWEKVWPGLLQYSQSLLSDDAFWDSPVESPYGAFIGNFNWVTSTVSRLVEAGCKKDEHAFDTKNIATAKAVLELILAKQPGEEFKLDDDAVTVAINSSRGRCLEAYINLALYECRNLKDAEKDHLVAWQRYEPVFSNELLKPDENEYEFAALATMYLSNFSYLSKSWVSDNLELMFGEVNSQRWLCALQGYNYASSFSEDIYDSFKKKHFFEALLDNVNLNDEAKGRYIERICLMHLWEKQQFGADDDPLSLLLKRGNNKELSKVIWWLWSIHDDNFEKSKELAFKLWPMLINRVIVDDKDGQLLASKLCLWVVFIEDLNEDTVAWLSAIAPYAGKDYNADTLLEGLAKLSADSPFEAASIWQLMLTKYSPVYADGAIQALFENLIKTGVDGQRVAKEVADIYLKFGASGIVNIYRQATEEK
ncbi:hypothetical protein [Vibrio crassostreae]|uniref:hypothetical protein n=1 Tax=Vibrio crassostreae TaxID=246167 RepID=UPI001B30BB27|nr:hypothetical protein [Vibrio crassostreae]CAK2714793.1 DUF4020 domain-containing protein [Vibrio crassostreae]